jgi:hypothetical protein
VVDFEVTGLCPQTEVQMQVVTFGLACESRDAKQGFDETPREIVMNENEFGGKGLDSNFAFYQPNSMGVAATLLLEDQKTEVEGASLQFSALPDELARIVAGAHVHASPQIEVGLEDATSIVACPPVGHIDSTRNKLISLRLEGLLVEFGIDHGATFGSFQWPGSLASATEFSVGGVEADLRRWVALHAPYIALGVVQTLDGLIALHAG